MRRMGTGCGSRLTFVANISENSSVNDSVFMLSIISVVCSGSHSPKYEATFVGSTSMKCVIVLCSSDKGGGGANITRLDVKIESKLLNCSYRGKINNHTHPLMGNDSKYFWTVKQVVEWAIITGGYSLSKFWRKCWSWLCTVLCSLENKSMHWVDHPLCSNLFRNADQQVGRSHGPWRNTMGTALCIIALLQLTRSQVVDVYLHKILWN